MAELTSAQTLKATVIAYGGTFGAVQELAPSSQQSWFEKVRRIRRHPTVSFIRRMTRASLLTSKWSVESVDENKYAEQTKHITEQVLEYQTPIMQHACRGIFDYGFAPFEVVRRFDPETELYEIVKVKQLLQDYTTLLVGPNGDLLGVRNAPSSVNLYDRQASYTDVFLPDSLVYSFETEGTDWYGEPMARSTEMPYDCWMETNDASRRFDRKQAGAQWVVHYPQGYSTYNGIQNVENSEIANDILNRLVASGNVAIPNVILGHITDLNQANSDGYQAWRIELITAPSAQSAFRDRLSYLDSLIARSFGWPERALLEGQFGTKAEAQAHADFAIDSLEQLQFDIVTQTNKQLVDSELLLNWGPAYKKVVKIVASPISDVQRAILRQIYFAHLNDPNGGGAQEADRVDYEVVRDELGIPVRKAEEVNDERVDAPVNNGDL